MFSKIMFVLKFGRCRKHFFIDQFGAVGGAACCGAMTIRTTAANTIGSVVARKILRWRGCVDVHRPAVRGWVRLKPVKAHFKDIPVHVVEAPSIRCVCADWPCAAVRRRPSRVALCDLVLNIGAPVASKRGQVGVGCLREVVGTVAPLPLAISGAAGELPLRLAWHVETDSGLRAKLAEERIGMWVVRPVICGGPGCFRIAKADFVVADVFDRTPLLVGLVLEAGRKRAR